MLAKAIFQWWMARVLTVALVLGALLVAVNPAPSSAAGPALVSSTGTVTVTSDGSQGVAVAMPPGIQNGDLLLVIVASDLNNKEGTTTGSAGWVKVLDARRGTDVTHLSVFARIADGNDAFTVATTFTPNTFAEDLVAQSVRITNHGVTNVSTDLAGLTSADDRRGSANPPSTGTIAEDDWLVFALAAPNFTSQSDNLRAVPSGYTEITRTRSANTTSAATLGIAYQNVSGTTIDPGKYGNTSRSWVAATLAIPSS